MINISSRTRNVVKRMFDTKYYQTHGNKKRKSRILARIPHGIHGIHVHKSHHSKNSNEHEKEMAAATSAAATTNRNNNNASTTTRTWGKNDGKQNTFDKKEFMTCLMEEYEKQCKKIDLTEIDLFSWLFEKLLHNMELSVKEIAKVLNDSFYRFQSNTKLFHHVVNLAMQNKKLDV